MLNSPIRHDIKRVQYNPPEHNDFVKVQIVYTSLQKKTLAKILIIVENNEPI